MKVSLNECVIKKNANCDVIKSPRFRVTSSRPLKCCRLAIDSATTYDGPSARKILLGELVGGQRQVYR